MSHREPGTDNNYGIIQTGGTSYVGNQAVGPHAMAVSRQPTEASCASKAKVLFLAANPGDMTSLHLDIEIREIQKTVRDELNVVVGWAVRADDLLQHLNEHRPQIVHFSGHGTRTGKIVVEDNDRNSVPLSLHAVTHLFGAFADTVRLVVLNACFSLPQAEAITKVVDCATGTPSGIDDSDAIAFSVSFYQAIGFGRSVAQAFDQGCIALDFRSAPEALRPLLLAKKGVDPASVTIL